MTSYKSPIPRMPQYCKLKMREEFNKIGKAIDGHYHSLPVLEFEKLKLEYDLDDYNFNISHIVYNAMRISYYITRIQNYKVIEYEFPEWMKERNP